MKLVYSKSRCNHAEVVHRFDVLGDLLPGDLDVLKNSLHLFFHQLGRSGAVCPITVLDLSECTLKVIEAKLQVFISEMKTHALASQIFLNIAQSDIESMHAEQKAVEQSLLSRINLLENKLSLAESVKDQIRGMQMENRDLREKIKDSKKEPKNGKKARTIFEKLWGES